MFLVIFYELTIYLHIFRNFKTYMTKVQFNNSGLLFVVIVS
jgi:hypothetical protein